MIFDAVLSLPNQKWGPIALNRQEGLVHTDLAVNASQLARRAIVAVVL